MKWVNTEWALIFLFSTRHRQRGIFIFVNMLLVPAAIFLPFLTCHGCFTSCVFMFLMTHQFLNDSNLFKHSFLSNEVRESSEQKNQASVMQRSAFCAQNYDPKMSRIPYILPRRHPKPSRQKPSNASLKSTRGRGCTSLLNTVYLHNKPVLRSRSRLSRNYFGTWSRNRK